MTRLTVRKYRGALVALGRESQEAMDRLSVAATYRVDVSVPRNIQQHNLFWALCRLVADNSERFTDAEHVAFELKINTGHADMARINVPGVGECDYVVPKSIRFDRMDGDKFKKWLDRALDYVVKEILPGIDRDSVKAEIFDMVNG